MDNTQAPSPADLVRRASELAPLLRKNALLAEEERRLPEDSLAAIADAGLLKLRVPQRYGGYESDMRGLVDVLAELAKGDGSAAWTVAVFSICAWLVGLFPDETQEEIFATPDVRVCGLLSPTGSATPADGGFVINGRWAFNTGALHSQWNSLVAMAPAPDGSQWPVMALAPMSDIEIVDDWHTSGLRGSGSVTTVAKNVFVPAHRVIPMGPALQEVYASKLNADRPVYRTPLLPTAATSTVGAAVGLAKAARDGFFERLPGRRITYTTYESQLQAPITHLQVAEAALRVDEAEFHAYRAADLLDNRSKAGESATLAERAGLRADLGRAYQLAKEAIDIYSSASGASSIYRDVPIQRIVRDIQTLNLHAILNPNSSYELYGRVLCGLEPNTMYV
jgi:3-hydroxy-9,10-secoandrosta-1,3,5(10)-triene-9,17-dione monooxygenase